MESHYELSLFHGVFISLLIIGCVYQVLDISYLYFNYKTNVNVRLERESIVEIPALSICTNVTQTIKIDYLLERFPQSLDINSSKWIQTKYLQKLSLREQLLDGTVGPDQLLKSCLIMKTMAFENGVVDRRYPEGYIDCRNVSKVRQYLNSDEKCITIMSQLMDENEDKFRVDHDITVRDNAFILFKVVMRNQYLDNIYIKFHSRWLPMEGFYSGQTPFMQIYNHKYSGILIEI